MSVEAETTNTTEISGAQPKVCPFCLTNNLQADSRRIFVEIGSYLADLAPEQLQALDLDIDPDISSLDRYEEEGEANRYECKNCGQGLIAW